MTNEEMLSEVQDINHDIAMVMRASDNPSEKDPEIWEDINERIFALVDDVIADFLDICSMVRKNEEYRKIEVYSVLWNGKFKLLQKIDVDFAITEYNIRLSNSFFGTSTHPCQSYEPKCGLESLVTEEQVG